MEIEKLKILLVENDAEFTQQVGRMLAEAKGASFELASVVRIEDGVARLADGGIDCVLIDLSLPDGAGLASIKRLEAEAPRLPVIILGNVEDEAVAVEAVHEGAQDYLVRSQLNPQLLGRAIRHAVERQRAEAALLEAEEKYRGIFEHIVEGIFQTTPAGRYLSANTALARIYGYGSPEELMGSVRDIGRKLYVDPFRRAEFIQIMQEHDTVTDFESRIYRKDGSIIWIAENVRAIRDAKGKLLHYEGTVEDITQRKLAEEKLQQATAELARSREALSKKNEQMEEDLKMAREIQLTMLPQEYPVFPKGAKPPDSRFRFSHRYLPTGVVGGDFFNVLALSDTEAGVFICDVMGHGVRSALISAMVWALVEELKPLGKDPGKLLTQLNRDLCAVLKHTGSPTLTTAFYLVADAATGRFRYANAGHPKPLLVRRSTGQLDSMGSAERKSQPALGLFEEAVYATSDGELHGGDRVMLFTDGLYEVEGPQQQLYTHEMLIEAVRRRIKLPVGELFDQLLDEIKEFAAGQEFMDDVCLVGMEVADREQVVATHS